MNCRLIALGACLVALSVPSLSAARSRALSGLSDWRRSAGVAEQSGAALPIARSSFTSLRCCTSWALQELEWRPQSLSWRARQSDLVAHGSGFTTTNFARIVVDYERLRTEG